MEIRPFTVQTPGPVEIIPADLARRVHVLKIDLDNHAGDNVFKLVATKDGTPVAEELLHPDRRVAAGGRWTGSDLAISDIARGVAIDLAAPGNLAGVAVFIYV